MKNLIKLTLFFLFFSTLTLVFSENSTISYTIKHNDSLQSIARDIYSRKPHSEKVGLDNSYRWLLILKENPALEITFNDFGWNPIVLIETNQHINIPIFEGKYPGVAELEIMISEEMATAKSRIKNENEAIEIQKIAKQKGNEIKEIILTEDTSGDMNIERIIYNKLPYRTSDQSKIPVLDTTDPDIFIWKIIENSGAKKTIILFPDSHTDYIVGYKKFLAMKSIADANKDKAIKVFLESIDNVKDYSVIDKFRELKKSKNNYDFSKILTKPYSHYRNTREMRAGMIPSMALFYYNEKIEISGAENRNIVNEFYTKERYIDLTIYEKYKEYEYKIIKEFNDNYNYHTFSLIKNIETSIVESSQKNNITDTEKIAELNDLQKNFANIYLYNDFSYLVLSKYDDWEIKEIFGSIDELCGANTAEIYSSYKTKIIQNREKLVSGETEIDLSDHYTKLVLDINSELLLPRDKVISDSFSSLEDGSIGLCELGTGHINNQISLCLNKKDYNLIIFNHPSLKYELYSYADPQDPREHKDQLAKNILGNDFFNDLIIPEDYKEKYSTDIDFRNKINKEFIILRRTDFLESDKLLKEDQTKISIQDINNIGSISRVSKIDINKNVDINFYFIPKREEYETTENVKAIENAPNISEKTKKSLIKLELIKKATENL